MNRDTYMIWENYKSILLLENPKQKIAKFKIEDPYLKNFIFRYENLLPWNELKNSQDINNYISSVLIPNLIKKTKLGENFDKNNTLFTTKINWDRQLDMLKAAAENGDQQAAISLESFKKDPEKAKNKIITDINNNKNQLFRSWENYILNYNEIYKKHPAFQFIILNSIYKGTDNTRTTGIVPLNQNTVSSIFEKIKKIYESDEKQNQNFTFDVLNDYVQISIQEAEKNKETIVSGDGKWIKIPSKNNDPENFESNVDLLMSLSTGTNWCIAGESFANSYLSQGDFYIFFRNINDKNTGVAAIRMVGDEITEIRGTEQNQEMNDIYIDNVLDLVNKENLQGGEKYVKRLQSKKYIKPIIEKIRAQQFLTDEDRKKIGIIMSTLEYNNYLRPECINIEGEDKILFFIKNSNEEYKINLEKLIIYLHLAGGELSEYILALDDRYYEFMRENFNSNNYFPRERDIDYILSELDKDSINKIYNLAKSEGWVLDNDITNYNQIIKNLSKWLWNREGLESYEIIKEAYGWGMIADEYNKIKESIIAYLNRNFLEFIKKGNEEWNLETTYPLRLKLKDAFQLYKKNEDGEDIFSLITDHFNIESYHHKFEADCDYEYAANILMDKLNSH